MRPPTLASEALPASADFRHLSSLAGIRVDLRDAAAALELAVEGCELDMGTGFDDMSERSQPVLEPQMLARGEISSKQIENRQLLRDVMFQAGWVGIHSEWWHFDCGDRILVRSNYTRVLSLDGTTSSWRQSEIQLNAGLDAATQSISASSTALPTPLPASS